MAAVLGLFVGGLVIFAVEYLDDRVKSPEELRSVTGPASLGSMAGGLASLGSISQQRVTSGAFPTILNGERERSALSESYKYLWLNLEFAGVGTGDFKSILVTSALPGEGKTTTAANLAISLAREGKSVVLVDSDLRKPAIHKIFDLDNYKGLTNLIMGSANLDDVLLPSGIETLKVIASGPPPPDPTVLLRSARMRETIKSLADRTDVVIFDSPPVLHVTDPIVMATQVDGIIMVLNAQHAQREPLKRAAQSLQQANTPLIGAVMNKISVRGKGYIGYGYGYGYENSNSKNGLGGQLRRIFPPKVLKTAIRRIKGNKETGVK